MGDDYLKLFVEETSFYNDIVLGSLLPECCLWVNLPHFYRGFLRNYIGGILVYFVTGILWSFYIYHFKHNVYLPQDAIPSNRAMLMQIHMAMKAMHWYCLLPCISEYLIENGWTKCFPSISDVGWLPYFVYVGIYLVFLEFSIYWLHREFHEIKPLYNYFHAPHHMYNKKNTLSPWAGLAFDPIDGLSLAVPHVVAIFLVPMHFRTHLTLLFIEAIWAANAHDGIHGKIWPVMGGGYHAIHHLTYRHNYGHYTIWMDWMFGTLRHPSAEG